VHTCCVGEVGEAGCHAGRRGWRCSLGHEGVQVLRLEAPQEQAAQQRRQRGPLQWQPKRRFCCQPSCSRQNARKISCFNSLYGHGSIQLLVLPSRMADEESQAEFALRVWRVL
jgi:hypothetical protein